jgi:hypothetical protein
MQQSLRFWIALAVAVLPQLSVVYVSSAAPVQFIVLLTLWNVAPMLLAAIFFVAGARYAAWGWLVAVALLGLWEVVGVLQSHSSTAGLGFMWGPVWSFVAAGPIGAVVGVLVGRDERRRNIPGQPTNKD